MKCQYVPPVQCELLVGLRVSCILEVLQCFMTVDIVSNGSQNRRKDGGWDYNIKTKSKTVTSLNHYLCAINQATFHVK